MANEDLIDKAAALLRSGANEDDGYEARRQEWLDRYYLSRDPKVWQVNVNGSGVKVEDLPLAVIDKIAKESGTSWLVIVNQPLLDLAVAQDLVGAAATHLGKEPPEGMSVRNLVDWFVLVSDTVPEPDPTLEADDPLVPLTGPTSGTPG